MRIVHTVIFSFNYAEMCMFYLLSIVLIYLQVFTMQGSVMPSLLVLHVNVITNAHTKFVNCGQVPEADQVLHWHL